MSGPICFVHVPKTAGATMRDVLTRAFPPAANGGNWLNDPDRTRAKVAHYAATPGTVVMGHVPYGVYVDEMPADARYVTLLREPVDRVLSHYHRHIERRRIPGRELVTSLAAAFQSRSLELSNLATRLLSDDPAREPDTRSLDEATANLGRFTFVGLQDRFDESVVLLLRALGVTAPIPYGASRHVNEDRPAANTLSHANRRLVVERNALDVALYAHARNLFSQRAGTHATLAADVEQLRTLRAPLLVEYHRRRLAMGEWLERRLPPETTMMLRDLKAQALDDGFDPTIMRDALKVMRGERRAVVLVLADDRRLVTSERRFLSRAGGRVLYLDPDESRVIGDRLSSTARPRSDDSSDASH